MGNLTEYAAGFQYSESEKGITCTRVYHYDPDGTDSGVTLPEAGDTFTAPSNMASGSLPMPLKDLDGLICRQRTITPLAGHPGKFEWQLVYTNEPVDESVFTESGTTPTTTAVADLPKSIEFGGEFTTITPKADDGWKWDSDNSTVIQPLPFRVNTSTLRIVRYVSKAAYATFQTNVRNLTGHVNHADNPFGTDIGGGLGCWLFTGATAEYFRNAYDEAWWRVEMIFVYRNPDQSNVQGWNTILRLDGKWDYPINPNPSGADDGLYLTGDFAGLFDDTVWSTP